MTKLDRLRNQALKEKAAILECCPVNHIKNVTETANGAIVEKSVGCPSVRVIPLAYWIGELIDAS